MGRKDLDNLTTKQDFLRSEKLTAEQEAQLLDATKTERGEFKNKRPLTKEDLPNLAKVEFRQYVYLANTVENPYLTSEMKIMLDEIEARFSKEDPNGFFIIVSMTRIGEEQTRANPKIADTGTHPKGEAVDFAGKFMLKHFTKSAQILKRILIEMENEEKNTFS